MMMMMMMMMMIDFAVPANSNAKIKGNEKIEEFQDLDRTKMSMKVMVEIAIVNGTNGTVPKSLGIILGQM